MPGTLRNLFRSSAPSRKVRSRRRLFVEPMEARRLLAVFTVDANDPTANEPGDKLFAQIQEAVDIAEPGDKIKVNGGVYEPFTVSKDNLTIRAASEESPPVIDATGADAGVHVDADGVTLRGLIVENADLQGFLITGGSHTLSSNTARNNGLEIDPSDLNALFQNSNLVAGFTLVDADDNRLTDNVAEANVLNGFLLRSGSDNNRLIGNSASSNGTSVFGGAFTIGNGFSVQAGTDPFNATVEETSDGTTFESNNATDNGSGIVVSGGFRITPEFTFEDLPAEGTSFIGNTTSGNASIGLVASGTQGARIVGNISNGNRTAGFLVSASEEAAIHGNTAGENGLDGFALLSVDNSHLSGNTATDNGQLFPGRGFYVSGGDGNSVTGNAASGNAFGGFNFISSSGNTLSGNTAEENGEDGFLLLASSDNTLKGNDARSNGRDGFRLQSTGIFSFEIVADPPAPGDPPAPYIKIGLAGFRGSENNTLQGNVAGDNGGAGFHLLGAVGNTLKGNTALENGGDGFRLATLEVYAPVSPFVVNSGELIGTLDSDNNVIEGNSSKDNGGWGYYVDEVLSNLFENNEAEGNALGDFNQPGIG